jgi:uncharacterized protein YjbJ (UPF0337 family)
MGKENIKGAADKAEGAVKGASGKLVGDTRLQGEGKTDKGKSESEAREAPGDATDAVKRTEEMMKNSLL